MGGTDCKEKGFEWYVLENSETAEAEQLQSTSDRVFGCSTGAAS